ncbi:helix-turn-helix domain-containing protein [Clostridium intestinale]|uniref:Helix-turn-helix n=1 Tax=Clostridium intestinale DSM 6191 TaxID=1121320 RepID=A0A1M6A4I8_9CLOT|nr:helix-turn-helix transcriptional regulator [Clostridium intestinale]SHI31376.1 Helix-turn-helix [Clostridium intestinale DSM 6191]
MSSLVNDIGILIRTLRKQRNLSQEQLAFKANLHPTYIGQVERGEKNITISNLDVIVKSLDITLQDFFYLINTLENKKNITFKIIDILKNMNYQEQRDLINIINNLVEWKRR